MKNEGNEDASFVKVIRTFYDSTGEVVNVEDAYTDPSDISIGQTSPFDVIVISQTDKIDSYALQVAE